MLYPKQTCSTICSGIPALLANINCALSKAASNLYNDTIYMLNKPVKTYDLLMLINYKRILTAKYCDASYCPQYSVDMIASRVKKLTLNCHTKNLCAKNSTYN